MARAARPRGRAPQIRGRRNECTALDQLLGSVRSGESRVLVVRGEPGVGKTALLDYLAERATGCRVERAAGIQSEMELAFAGLHQLCAPMLDRLGHLPVPQQEALLISLGLGAGAAPDRFLVGLAVLGLLSEVAGERPLICIMDDQQWLDRASAQVLGFVARRLGAESVGLVFAARVPGEDVAGLPELPVEGLRDDDARALLRSVLTGPMDGRVRDQILAETHGNPLALLELPRGVNPEQLAGGFGLPGAVPLSGRIEETFGRRIETLPSQSRSLLQLAAADPSGDPLLVWRAAGQLGIGMQAAVPAAEAGLVDFGAQVRFRHPLVRSAAYRSASAQQRREAHRALAQVTDPEVDPDRRAWHQAQAASGPDEDVAAELVRSASRAQARGGLSAAAAFLERAALLTPKPADQAQRLLVAARAKRNAGALDAALGLLVAAEAHPLGAIQTAEMELLRGQIASDQHHGTDSARLLLSAARLFEPVNVALARETYLEVIWAAMWAGDLDTPDGIRQAAEAARAAPPGPDPLRPIDVLLDGFALRFTQGYGSGAPTLAQALERLLALDAGSGDARRWLWLAGGRVSQIVAMELWNFESWSVLAAGQVKVARDIGALGHLRFAISLLILNRILAGELATAGELVEEDRMVAQGTGSPPVAHDAMMLAAWQGREREASDLVEAISQAATATGMGLLASFAAWASSVLHNSFGRHELARDAARRALELGPFGLGPIIVPELAEAASKTGDVTLLRMAAGWLSERTQATPNEWVLGIESRVLALLGQDDVADSCYRESIGHLRRSGVRAELARSHLLYGEWLQREGRRADARNQLRTACGMLETMGMDAFAERARRELQAAGETAGKRIIQVTAELTAQEAQIARLARDGLSNPQIGARLFISTRTVQYHLNKVFIKLSITSRGQLHRALPSKGDLALPR